MNIFFLDEDLCEAAKHHDVNKHQTKMILEATQMASTALHEYGLSDLAPYRPTHRTHPMVRWVGESFDNWLMAREYAGMLHEVRYGVSYEDVLIDPSLAEHKSMKAFASIPQRPVQRVMPSFGVTPRPKCVPDEFERESVVESYREYYRTVKTAKDWFEWHEVPDWA